MWGGLFYVGFQKIFLCIKNNNSVKYHTYLMFGNQEVEIFTKLSLISMLFG
jgi:hypothetical protein